MEKRITLAMMQLKGWASVKGAGFCQEHATEPKELRGLAVPAVCGCGVPVGHARTKAGSAYTFCPRSRM
eukprot:408418-Rhodomonas_salina.1